MIGTRIHINGIVQGVGFRPFVFNLAEAYHLNGWVRNSSAGVDIEVQGAPDMVEGFISDLRKKAPPLSKIDEFIVDQIPEQGFSQFKIIHSENDPGAFVPISPDVTICGDCLEELFTPDDRRFLYPFINCTNCGPRFTIIKDIPYDRPYTTMADFPMCPECRAEYEDPKDRRFHAQPVACPKCGPHIWLTSAGEEENRLKEQEALQKARHLLKEGKILAIRGLGGFHLACDATNGEAVSELRKRKLRVGKPFALMLPSIQAIEKHCQISPSERDLIASRERPIVVVRKKPESSISTEVAPNQHTLGVMLPYTPLHKLLLEEHPDFPDALVMTSGNLSDEPIATDNQEALKRLEQLADFFLLHNRDIHIRCDDSVIRAVSDPTQNQSIYHLRRSRGYAPFPVRTAWKMPQIFAAGAELKNTFCLTKDRYAFVSHHIGDLENYETMVAFIEGVEHYQNLFRVCPEVVAYDLHQDYLATRIAVEHAQEHDLPAYSIQHHHAHIAACMAEYSLPADEPVIGLSFDGTGFGTDGTIWGGEFLLATYTSSDRVFHLKSVPLPGGDSATKEPWRMALSWLDAAGVPWDETLPPVKFAGSENIPMLHTQIEKQINAPLTSSIGRLFDAAASIA
ncbi:MAG: carbamoyltransferase HypF, partial [Anaerolineales bacterium]